MSDRNYKFDPLFPTDMERLDIFRGYQQGYAGWPMPEDDNEAYYHGRKLGFNARHGEVDDETRELIARARQAWIEGKIGRKPNVFHRANVSFTGGMPFMPMVNYPKR